MMKIFVWSYWLLFQQIVVNGKNAVFIIFCIFELMLSNCSIFQFSRYSDFADWYIGKAGFYQTLQVPDLKKGRCFGDNEDYNYVIIAEDRHPIFLHFRTPEIYWNPQGWMYYPSTFNYCGILKRGRIPSKYKKVPLGRSAESRSLNYLGGEAGLLDSLIPYKVLTAENMDMDSKMQFVYFSPILFFFNFLGKLFVFPVYMFHDIIKIPVIPAAVIYYSIPSEKEPVNEIQKDGTEKDNKNKDKYKGLLPEEAEEMRIREGEKN
ncbi:MAG TPA: hypothetical protein PKK94_18535 [Leptospiraceae bacterium]|nr:hypothetical protein [Leptospiraceae bacterium]